MRITEPFPLPPGRIRQALNQLDNAVADKKAAAAREAEDIKQQTKDALASGSPIPTRAEREQRKLEEQQRRAAAGVPEPAADPSPAELPRPWIPATCPPLLRKVIWQWLDDVAAWLNHEYCWPAKRTIPPCWAQHPHIAHELAVLAFLRNTAEAADSPAPLEEWHRNNWPLFMDRALVQLDSGCGGQHTPWPAKSRHHEFVGDKARPERMRRIAADSEERQGHTAPARPEPAAPTEPPEEPPDWVDHTTGELLTGRAPADWQQPTPASSGTPTGAHRPWHDARTGPAGQNPR